MKKSLLQYDVIIEQDENKVYIARVPALPGCHSEGDTLGEVVSNIKEAMELYLEYAGSRIQNPMKFVGVKKIAIRTAV